MGPRSPDGGKLHQGGSSLGPRQWFGSWDESLVDDGNERDETMSDRSREVVHCPVVAESD